MFNTSFSRLDIIKCAWSSPSDWVMYRSPAIGYLSGEGRCHPPEGGGYSLNCNGFPNSDSFSLCCSGTLRQACTKEVLIKYRKRDLFLEDRRSQRTRFVRFTFLPTSTSSESERRKRSYNVLIKHKTNCVDMSLLSYPTLTHHQLRSHQWLCYIIPIRSLIID